MKTTTSYTYVAAVVSMLLWGMSFVWTAILLKDYTPITIIFLRLGISSAFMFLILWLSNAFQRIKKEHFLLFFMSALFNPFFYFIGENYGVMYTSPTISAVIIATIPLMAPIAAWFLLKERLSRLNILGLVVSFMGIIIMLVNSSLKLDADPKGIGALLFAVMSAVFYSIALKKLSDHYKPFFLIAVQNLIGMIYFLPLFLWFELDNFRMVKPNGEMIFSLFSLAILCSSFAFVLFTIAMRSIGVARVNVFSNLIPVFTGIFSYFVIGEQVGSQKIMGIIIVISGLFLSQLKKRKSLI